jgi:hypothetical protein
MDADVHETGKHCVRSMEGHNCSGCSVCGKDWMYMFYGKFYFCEECYEGMWINCENRVNWEKIQKIQVRY